MARAPHNRLTGTPELNGGGHSSLRGRVDLYYGLTVVWLDTPQRAGVFAIRAAKCAMKSDEVLCISLGAGRI